MEAAALAVGDWTGFWTKLRHLFTADWPHPGWLVGAALLGLVTGLLVRRRPPRRSVGGEHLPPGVTANQPTDPGEPTPPAQDWETEAAVLATTTLQQQEEIENLQGRLVALNQQAQEKQARFEELALTVRNSLEETGGSATVATVRARWMRFAELLRIERQHVGAEAAGLQRIDGQLEKEAELLQQILQSAGDLVENHRRRQSDDPVDQRVFRHLTQVEDQARTLHQHLAGALGTAAGLRQKLQKQQNHLRELSTAATTVEEVIATLDHTLPGDPITADDTFENLGRLVAGMQDHLRHLETDLDAETRRVLDRIDWVVNDCSLALIKSIDLLKQQQIQDLGPALAISQCLRPTATLRGMFEGTQNTLRSLAPAVLPQSHGPAELNTASDLVTASLKEARASLVRFEQEEERVRLLSQEQETLWTERLAALQTELTAAKELAGTQESERKDLEAKVAHLCDQLREQEAAAKSREGELEQARAREEQSETDASEQHAVISTLKEDLARKVAEKEHLERSLESLKEECAALSAKLDRIPDPEAYEHLRGELDLSRQRCAGYEEELLSLRGRSISIVAMPTHPGGLGRRLLGLNPLIETKRQSSSQMEPSFPDAQLALKRLAERPGMALPAGPNGHTEDQDDGLLLKAVAPGSGLDLPPAEPLSLAGILDGKLVHPGKPEMIVFRGRDPRHWNTQQEGNEAYAISLDTVPADFTYLRLRRLDTGESVVSRCDAANLSGLESTDGTWGWVGDAESYAGARHLGFFSAGLPREAETRFGCGGWGFGHAAERVGTQAFAWAGKVIEPVDFEISVGSHPLAAPAEKSDTPSVPSCQDTTSWLLFRGNDPGLWNRTLYRGARCRARALNELPSGVDLQWLRLARLDTGEAVVLRLTGREELTSDGAGKIRGFNGGGECFYGAHHLGIFDELVPLEVETRFSFGGWGFGHRQGGEEAQAFGWAGREIPPGTVFEISVHSEAPPLGAKDVLLTSG